MARPALLTVGNSNPKMGKGEKLAYYSAVLHFAPHKRSGRNVCPAASKGCIAGCLNTAGHGGMFRLGEDTNVVQEARLRRTLYFFNDRDAFMAELVSDMRYVLRRAAKLGMTPVFRLNGTSDIRWENETVTIDGVEYPNLMTAFPTVQFMDYTKLANRRGLPSNYHLTFSLSETNDDKARAALERGLNVAVIFRGSLPKTFMGRPVINGDVHDLRFLDPKGCIVGLSPKGRARKDTSGFVRG